MPEQFITCPSCGKKIPVTEAFAHEVEQKVRVEFEGEGRKLREEHSQEMQEQEVEYRKQLGEQKTVLEAQARSQAEGAVATQLQNLTNQLNEKTEQIEEARKQELKLLKQVREVEERDQQLELEIQRQLAAERKAKWEKASKQAQDEHQLKDAEKDKQISDMRSQIDALKRKAEQGSQQAQGEVLELQLEEKLRTTFQFDSIEEVSKGARGADVLQVVRNEGSELCGKIL